MTASRRKAIRAAIAAVKQQAYLKISADAPGGIIVQIDATGSSLQPPAPFRRAMLSISRASDDAEALRLLSYFPVFLSKLPLSPCEMDRCAAAEVSSEK